MALPLTERDFLPPPSSLRAKQSKSKSNDSEKLYKFLNYFAVLLQFLGVLPVLKNSKVLLLLQRIWCALILIIIWTMSIKWIQYTKYSVTDIESCLFIGELIFTSILPLNIFIMSSVNKKEFLLISDKFKCLKKQLKLCRGSSYRPQKPFYSRLRQELCVLIIGISLYYLYCIFVNYVISNSRLEIFFTYLLPNIIISASLCLYWLALRFISLAICYSNSILQSFQKDGRVFHLSSHSKVAAFSEALWFQREFGSLHSKNSLKFYDIFVTLAEISSSLDQLTRDVVKIFRNVLIMNFIKSFLVLVLHFSDVYNFLNSPDIWTLIDVSIKFAGLFFNVFNIIFVLLSHTVIINQKCQTIYILNSLPVDNLNMEKSINYFLLQLKVRKHSVYVGDIFHLDLTFLPAITINLANFVIFLIQIDLGVVSTAKNSS